MRKRMIAATALLLASCAHGRAQTTQAGDASQPGGQKHEHASADRPRSRRGPAHDPERTAGQAAHRSADVARTTPGAAQPPAATQPGERAPNAPPAADVYGTRPDNTRVNERDRERSALTPFDQGENDTDRELTRRIRRAAVADDSLSFTAKNVKIITRNGQVTLRGPVNNARERDTLGQIARAVAGPARVSDELEVVE